MRRLRANRKDCESIKTQDWFGTQQEICKIHKTSIHSADIYLSSESNVTILNLNDNKNIHYLPIELYKSTPNLLIIDAGNCGVKAISEKNFEKLNKLEQLWIYHNEITIIPAGTFADLVSLEQISLGLKSNSDSSEHSSENSFQKRTKSSQSRETSFHHRFLSHTWISAPTFASMTDS
jgi:hypothetical protein